MRLDGVVTVVDAVNGDATLDEHMESVKQVAVADRIVLTKTDLLDTRAARDDERLIARLHALNPAAPHPRRRGRRGNARAPPRLRPVRPRAKSPTSSAGSPKKPTPSSMRATATSTLTITT